MTIHASGSCDQCSLKLLCLPVGLPENELWQLDEIVQRRRPIAKGQLLFRMGAPFTSVYAVRTGSLKTVLLADDGTEQVTGFTLAGEMLGLDAINRGRHPVSAVALESTSLCEIPFEKLDLLAGHLPSFRQHLMRTMSREIASDESLLALLGQRNAEQRLSAFLLSLSTRFRARGLMADHFALSMSRADIASHLGLTQETISRLFTQFRKQGLVEIHTRDLTLLDMDSLHRIAGIRFEPLSRIA
ncbi:fumarate/nitrate reduction transcriptional regulator Fnr [Thioalkalivibrio paradoxus]|uniref:Transcriptional regulator n=1 Tax=Thioalkalivibrio paradoxus ARh 1 TaxID=713585 RepID=W0DLT5_9GAMM|nr:fumarate/nitrate reduction transcriptional regulator Fnr [Thioalkalivibrio paradoxus]AHE97958.1 transcriptional regulator [Thioalkalivibrio paradoxus ARh 1]